MSWKDTKCLFKQRPFECILSGALVSGVDSIEILTYHTNRNSDYVC
jgi:hypothetical protein